MATKTVTASVNVDAIPGGWADGDTLVINNGAVVTVNTNQTKFWEVITINNGKLRIENTSTATGIQFLTGRSVNNRDTTIFPTSGLGSIEIAGNWISLGTGDGTAGQTVTSPWSHYIPALWVETGSGTGVYEIWLNATVECYDAWYFGAYPASKSMRGGTTDPRGRFFTQGVNTSYTAANASSDHWTTTITFGDGVTGRKPVSGANIRIPNIMISDATICSNQIAADGGYTVSAVATLGFINLSAGGSLTADKCLMDLVTVYGLQAQTLSLSNVGMARPLYVSECYDLTINGLGICTEPLRRYGAATTFAVRDNRYMGLGRTVLEYISGASITDLVVAAYGSGTATSTGIVLFQNSADVVFTGETTVYQMNKDLAAYKAMYLSNVQNTTWENLRTYGGGVSWNACSALTINALAYADMMNFNGCWSYASNFRLGTLPDGTALASGDKVYFKLRTYRTYDIGDGAQYWDGKEYGAAYSALTQSGGANLEQGCDQFGCIPHPTTSTTVTVTWTTLAVTPFYAYQIYRGTSPGFTVDAGSLVHTQTTQATVTWSDTGRTAETWYYYVLRRYETNGGAYTQSAEVPCKPTADNVTKQNLCLQSDAFDNASWTKTSVTVAAATGNQAPAQARGATTTTERLTASGAGGTVTQSIVTTNGVEYTFSVYLRSDTSAGISGSIGLGSATQAFTVRNKWQRISVTFTATGAATTATITITTNGTIIYAAHATVVAAASASSYTPTTTVAVSAVPAQEFTSVLSYQREGGAGIALVLATMPTGGLFSEIHASTTQGFTPSRDTCVGTTLAFTDSPYLMTLNNNLRILGFTEQGTGGCASALITATQSSDVLLRNATFNMNYTGSILANLSALSNRWRFQNISLPNVRTNTVGMLVVTANNAADVTFENVRSNHGGIICSPQTLQTVLKGYPGGGVRNWTNALLLGASTTEGVAVAYTTVYDTIFAELYHDFSGGADIGNGALNVLMNASADAAPPYALTGTAKFDNTGKLFFLAPGDACTWTWPHKILGVSGARSRDAWLGGTVALLGTVIASASGGVYGFVLPEFSLSTDGVTYGSWYAATGTDWDAQVNALTTPESTGFYLKVRLTARMGVNYDGQTVNFTPGDTVTFATTGGSGVLLEQYDAGATGFLIFSSFTPGGGTAYPQDNENIQVSGATRALVNGDSFPRAATMYCNGLQLWTTFDVSSAAKRYPPDVAPLAVTVLDGSLAPVQNARVRITAAETVGTKTTGDLIATGLTDVNGLLTANIDYEEAFGAGLSVTVRARKSSSAPYYKPADVPATLTVDGASATIVFVADQ